MISETLIKTALEETVKATFDYLKKLKLKLKSDSLNVEKAIQNHTNEIQNWSYEVTFRDSAFPKITKGIFIDIDISMMPIKQRLSASEPVFKFSSKDLFSKIPNHIVILGQPGAGKTTLTKFWCQSVIFEDTFFPSHFNLPIVIRLRDISEKHSQNEKPGIIINTLFNILGLSLEDENKISDEKEVSKVKERLVLNMLDHLKPLIILDGFDEIVTGQIRDSVLNDFRKLALNLRSGTVVLTSRSSDYNYSIENTSVLEICYLDQHQIEMFAKKWLLDDAKTKDFLISLRESPFMDTAIRPLTISHLCAIYERVGKIPEKPKTVYKKIISLLLEEWDEQRLVKRVSAYGKFEIDRKLEFLARSAYELTVVHSTSLFTELVLKETFDTIKFDFNLEHVDANKVIRELESHTGLIIESSYKTYEFAHKSLQEYLTAEYLVKLPSIPNHGKILSKIPNELAIAITISSNPSIYFYELVVNRLNYLERSNNPMFVRSFFSSFISRLILEKPDFNTSREINFAFIILYTLYRKDPSSQFRLFAGEIPAQFENFFELIFKRSTKFKYQEYYDFDTSYATENGEQIQLLKRIDEKIEKTTDEKLLPPFLFIKPSFIK